MARQKQGLELVKEGVSLQREDQDHQNRMQIERMKAGLAVDTAARSAADSERKFTLEQSKHALAKDTAAAKAAVDTYKTLHPPKPAAQVKPKAKPKGRK